MPGKVVSKEEWLVARKELLAKEKAATRARDELYGALRSDFPMVKLEKEYHFTGPNGQVTLGDIAGGNKQLIVYHFMLSPDDEVGCTGCSFLADNLPSSLGHLNSRDTALVLVSRAPLEKIEKFKTRMGWDFPWYSSFGSDFNYDFHASLDSDVTPPEYNYKPSKRTSKGEAPGLSVFFKEGDDIFHTYSTYERGLDILLGTHTLLDLTPLGRQDENGPVDWKLHDEY
ncbi:Uncharacterized protein BP5553_00723 [Venustampulla echinocandica]|uniref:DUF899-domain-containing protein n=1 Tax=Venustampulla echinocandica TaxID=2656787 RepID=A0A370TZ03_9HELO|nr:Uncharacterized protein BP5553_00723 [Venustampulla echinocandica]RDL40744.1 Uncharacterized protein BP5553_00723 [Venustampulla echinocandica]